MQFWNELEGQVIDGVYPLRRLVRSEGRSAWFETETSDPRPVPATISLTEALTDADEVVARLEAAQHLNHPNLVTITKVGQVRVDNTLVVYALMEPIEQSLSDVLQSQALTADEGREVAEALVGGLTAIHQNGMSHGRVEAASVLATEETVKLRSDCLHLSAAGQGDDVAGIGTTLFHAFTQRKGLTATDAQINRIPAPFAEIIRNSFARRWTLAQISNALKPVLPVASVHRRRSVPHPRGSRSHTRAGSSAPGCSSGCTGSAPGCSSAGCTAPPVARPEPPAPRPPVKTPPITERLTTPPIPVARAAKSMRRKGRPPSGARLPCTVRSLLWCWRFSDGCLCGRTPNPPPQRLRKLRRSRRLLRLQWPRKHRLRNQRLPSHPRPKVRLRNPRKQHHRPRQRRLLVRTAVPSGESLPIPTRDKRKAEEMVSQINEKHANLGAEVFAPKSGDYLVTVGGPMDHDQATKMLDKARRAGLPEDSYVQNFSR